MIASRRTAPTSRPAPDDGRALDPAGRCHQMLRRHSRGLSTPQRSGESPPSCVCVVAAYNYSLQTLVQEMSQQTPLAYLGLVPLIALLLAVVLALRRTRARYPRPLPRLHHRRAIGHAGDGVGHRRAAAGCRASTGSTGLTCSRCHSSSPARYRWRSACAPWCGFGQQCSFCFWHGHIPMWSFSTMS